MISLYLPKMDVAIRSGLSLRAVPDHCRSPPSEPLGGASFFIAWERLSKLTNAILFHVKQKPDLCEQSFPNSK